MQMGRTNSRRMKKGISLIIMIEVGVLLLTLYFG